MATMRTGEEQNSSTEQQEEARTVGRKRRTNGGTRRAAGDPARVMATIDDVRQSAQRIADDVRQRVEDEPVKTLAMAVGAGYILGGGLFTALTGRLLFGGLRIGLRLAALPLVRDELMGFVEAIKDRGRGETERRQQ
jgi:hypothetical protein